MNPILARTRAGLAAARATLRSPVVLVPTMGALHAGHRALLASARRIAQPGGAVLVSVFVNPLQFGPGEDLARYPRSLEDDMAVCAQEGVAVVFAPQPAVVYPADPVVTVSPGVLGQVLEGAFRPGFFDGVLTVVLKLLHLTAPEAAVFGEKDAQQLLLVRRMVADLDLPVLIESVPTVRDSDGLAASSRNRYLSPAERATGLALSRALRAAADAVDCGPKPALEAARAVTDTAARAEPPLAIDYLALADPVTLEPVPDDYAGEAVLLVAGRVGSTRLIDNAVLTFGSRS